MEIKGVFYLDVFSDANSKSDFEAISCATLHSKCAALRNIAMNRICEMRKVFRQMA